MTTRSDTNATDKDFTVKFIYVDVNDAFQIKRIFIRVGFT